MRYHSPGCTRFSPLLACPFATGEGGEGEEGGGGEEGGEEEGEGKECLGDRAGGTVHVSCSHALSSVVVFSDA